VAREMCALPRWEQRMSLAGQFTTFCCMHEQPINEECCAVFFMAILGVAPSTRLQYARMLRSVLQMDRTPLDVTTSGVTKNGGAVGDEAGAPLDKEKGGSIYPPPDRLEATGSFPTCVGDGESLLQDCGPDSQQFHDGAGRGHNFGLVRGAQDGGGEPPPRLAVRQGTRAGRVRHNKKLTNITIAHVEQAPWNATAHSIKRGASRHAAPIVEPYNLDSHAISQLAGHVNPFDLPQNTARYAGKYTTMLTQVSSLAALV
ncbi:hypothetical protein MOQ_000901, partial [Trypanosoma cruzi marinkellei]